MQDDRQEDASAVATDAKAQAAAERAQRYRERFAATQAARSRAAVGRPSEAEAARLVADFHARGGRVTVCPPAEEPQPDQPRTQRGRR